jgi:hypothetical protein
MQSTEPSQKRPWPTWLLAAVYVPVGVLASLGGAVVLVQDVLNRSLNFEVLREVFVAGAVVVVGAALAFFVGVYAMRGERVYLMVPFTVFLCSSPIVAGMFAGTGIAGGRPGLALALLALAALPLLAFLPVNRTWIAAKVREREITRSGQESRG